MILEIQTGLMIPPFWTSIFSENGLATGQWIGLVSHALTTHVKVSIKDDNLGLGAKLHKRKANGDGGLEEEGTAGLDAFQRILGRLNGKKMWSIKYWTMFVMMI